MDATIENPQPAMRNRTAMEAATAEGMPAVFPAAPRFALRLLQLGALAVVFAATQHRLYDLDRFFVPKELVLHATAFLAGLFALRALRRTSFTWIDATLLLYLGVSIVSALFAPNPYLAVRALAITASGLALFWLGRAMREHGLARPLLTTLALAVICAAMTCLLQAYGVRLDVFSLNRAPGGTLGNRNFIAHAAAFGYPLVLLAAFRNRLFVPGVPILTAALVLTRSRAAWLAFAAMAIVFLLCLILAPALRRSGRTWMRLLFILLLIGGGIAAALLLPNVLRWRSDNPYLDTVRDVANYQEGSGRGRLIQYQRSLRLVLARPITGTGPGNWPVIYPAHVPKNDPSLDTANGGMTFNPWPSSDWIAFFAERGLLAAPLMLVVFAGIALSAFGQLRRAVDAEEALLATTLLASLVAAAVVGAFDAVLLLGLPALLVWPAIGALWSAHSPQRLGLWPLLVLPIVLLGTYRSASQLVAMEISATRGDRASLVEAARIDPGNYRVRMRLARSGKRAQRCEHALAARALFPNATAARAVARGCDG